ncbi:hypothetical protein HII30_08445 [Paenibacillus lemnae]|uniref:Uncharacterized protein n=2 Tax=Paenibacillus lemnae TaxID=1330551 RepID=A0A848M4F2_PAELE|nr:hypothetical protein [Paenibacillus lemnae]
MKRKALDSGRSAGTGEDGAVSIFLIIALSVVFMFVAVFIDYARIAAMKVQSERLTHAAVRSVMSAYDQQLQQEYGLYAFGETSGDLIMGKTLNESLKPGERGDAFKLLPLHLDSSGLELQRPLGTYEIFNRQISEEMKYKAPIDFTLELISKFKPLSQSMKETSNTVDVLKKLRKLYDQREKALDDMLEKQREAGKLALPFPKVIMQPPGSGIEDESLGGGIETAADAAAQYNDYLDKSLEDASRAEDEEKQYTGLINDYLDSVSSLRSVISGQADSLRRKQEKLLQEAEEHLEKARTLNEDMKKVIQEVETRSTNGGYDQVTSHPVPGSDNSSLGDAEMIQSIRKQAEKLIHSDTFMNGFQVEISRQTSSSSSIHHQLSALVSSMGGAGMESTVLSASQGIEDYISKYGAAGAGNILDRQQAALEQFRTSDHERKETEKKAQIKLKEAAKVMESIRSGDKNYSQALQQFKELQGYYEESLSFNAADSGSPSGKEWDSDPYDSGKSSMDSMDGIFGSMSSLLGGVRDELFQNEYAVHYFQHFDITRLSGLAGNGNSSASGSLGDQLQVKDQEVEYILYGFHNPTANIAAAYGEIFASRLAIRTMEGFVVNSKMGNPLLILASAILYGIEKAIEDMITLCEKGSIEFSKYVPVTITYRDHLRIFLLLHGSKEKKMSRMLALIEFNTGINPAERGTYASSQVVFAMNLWFLPGVTKSLGSVFQSGSDEVQGSKYIVTRKADFSY